MSELMTTATCPRCGRSLPDETCIDHQPGCDGDCQCPTVCPNCCRTCTQEAS